MLRVGAIAIYMFKGKDTSLSWQHKIKILQTKIIFKMRMGVY